jgi:hypothetical protein
MMLQMKLSSPIRIITRKTVHTVTQIFSGGNEVVLARFGVQ